MVSPHRSAGASLPGSRQILSGRRVRPSLLQPILNMGRFFVGDSIPRLPDAGQVTAAVKDVKIRKLPVTPAADALLAQLVLVLVRRDLEPADREALGLLAGLALLVVEDDYFYVPETTEAIGPQQVLELARELAATRAQENQRLARVVAAHRLSLARTEDLGPLRPRVPPTEEFTRLFARLEVHLRQGEQLLRAQRDPARRLAHQERFQAACQRTVNLIGRLLLVPREQDHSRLRKRIVSRELKWIEVEALGAARVSDKEQAVEAQRLLAQTGVGESDVQHELSSAEIAARLAEIRASAVVEEAAEPEDESGAGEDWFFDME